MPLSKVGLVRTDGQSNAPKGKDPFIPLYSVLFWYGKDTNFVNTASGTLDYDYYRKYTEICYPTATFYNPDGTLNTLESSPLIACINVDNGWNTNTGLCLAATTSIPNTAATLFESHTHNPTTLGRTTIYKALGYNNGDTQSTNVFYIEQKGDYTHKHNANNIANALRSITYGQFSATSTTTSNTLVVSISDRQGIQSISVTPILRDPRLTTTGTGYNDTKLTFLPKDVLVFGNNLPTQYFTQTDNTHSAFFTATNKVLPLIAQEFNLGAIGRSGSVLDFTVSSNTVLNHNHNIIPTTKTYRSNKTSTAYKVVDAGAHSHQVVYTANVEIKSKILKAWVTKSANTPIANGVIIGYSIGENTLYQGLSANSKGLPFGWCFCDGTNGTPDLRGYYIYANLNSSNTYHDVVYKSSNTLTISSIFMAANGNHSHLGPITAQETGTGAAVDIGSHTYETNLDHTHAISTANTFAINPTDTSNVVNIKVGQSYSYTPPTVKLAFIMYNNTLT